MIASLAERGLKPLHVLVAEDDRSNAKLLGLTLKLLGCSWDWVENGQAAVDAVRTGNYALVLMDLQMPIMDGFQATRAIRAWELSQKSPPVNILAQTANLAPGVQDQCREAGLDGYLSKPLSPQRLIEVIVEVAARIGPSAG